MKLTAQPDKKRPQPRGQSTLQTTYMLPLGIFIIGIVLSALSARWIYDEINAKANAEFQRDWVRTAGEVTHRFTQPIHGLNGLRGAYAADHNLSRAQFNAYVASLNLPEKFPGVRGFGFIQRVQRADLDAFIAETRADGAPHFALRQLQNEQYSDLYIVKFLAPGPNNSGVEGLDVGSEAVRRLALQQTVDRGEATLSGAITLIQDKRKTPGVLLFVPVYRGGTVPATVEERRASLLGMLYAPILVVDLLSDIPEVISGRVDIELFDSTQVLSPQTLLFDADGSESIEASPHQRDISLGLTAARTFHNTQLLELPGRTMSLRVTSTPMFEARIERYSPWLLFAFGAALSSALALLIRQQASGRDRAEALARAMTTDLESALRDNNALLSTLNIHGIISTTDASGGIIDVNDAFCRISGYDHGELIGQNHRILNSDFHSDAFWQTMWNNIANGISWRGEVCNRAKQGDLYWVDTTIAPFRNSEGQIEKYISIQFDITASKDQQIKLAIARNQLIKAADIAELGIWSLNMLDHQMTFDARMNDIYQIPPEINDGRLTFEYWYNHRLHPDDRAKVDESITAATTQGNEYRQIFRVVIGERIRFIESAGMIERDERGNPVMMMGINRDITQQREAEQTLQAARQAADEANHAKSAFLANMSHELRTPMNAILGMLTLLRKTGLNAKQADYAIKSEAATRTLLRLLNDILDFSKIEAGKMTLDIHQFDINHMLRDLAVILSSNMKLKQVEMLFDIDPALPQYLLGDNMRLQQVLINLGGNALKFTERGEVVLFIKVRSKDTCQVTLHIGVRDTGIGIAPEHQARIFSGFTQAEATITRRFGGTGLGLAISQRFVSLMGGTLQLESQLGQGSQFHFTITLNLPDSTQNSDVVQRSIGRYALDNLDKMRVLVVDDNPTACDLIKRMGESIGWIVDVADSGERALQLLEQNANVAYGALFIDWQMPGLDGWQTSKRVREMMPTGRTPLIVMVTAQDREMLLQRSEEDQALLDGFLVKPVTASMLLDAITDATVELNPTHISSSEPSAIQQLAGIRLLVVEDNLNNQQIARELLTDEGATVTVARHGQEAIDILQAEPTRFDAVLMDLQMPVMDGFTATRYIREKMGIRELPIIAMTANAMASDRDACLAAGMNDHVGKPFDLRHLIKVLRKHTGLHEITEPADIAPSPQCSPQIISAAAAAGIDLESSLRRLGGDIQLYQTMLSLFAADLASFPEKLQDALAQDDRPSASRLLHTIKGLSAQLGADALAQSAGSGEKLLLAVPSPSTDDIVHLVQDINAQISAAAAGVRSLRQAMTDGIAPSVAPQAADQAAAADEDAFIAALRQIVRLLQNSDMAALNAVSELQAQFGARLGAHGVPLSDAVNRLDFMGAAQLCSKLLDGLSATGEKTV